MTESPETNLEPDSIERSIELDVSAEQVFALVSRPGWWINQGTVVADPDLSYEDGTAVITDAQWGKFRVTPLVSEAPSYASFRWLDREDITVGTTVEFWITERDSGVALRVLESGFDTLGNTPAQVQEHIAENTQGWETELGAARTFLTEEG